MIGRHAFVYEFLDTRVRTIRKEQLKHFKQKQF